MRGLEVVFTHVLSRAGIIASPVRMGTLRLLASELAWQL